MIDYAHELRLPLQEPITATETMEGQPTTISETLMDAISAWQSIKDDTVAYQVGQNIQRRIDDDGLIMREAFS